MANTNDPTVKIELRTAYDNSGAREAADDLQDLSQAAARAMQGSGSSADDEAMRSQALAEMMKLEAKTRRELEAEIKRLTAARKEAAAAGDTERFSALTTQLGRVKKAHADMRNAANLNKAALMGQASAGMQFANTLGSLGSQLKSGQVDVADMANGVMSLGMALKAGLGPIGWVMAGIQALSTVMQLYIDHQQEAAKAAEELAAAQNKAAEAAVEAGKAIANAQDARTRKAFEEAEKERKRETDNEKQKTDNILNAQKNRISGELKLLSEEQAKEEAVMKARIAKGEASEKELQDMRAEYAQKRENLNAELAGAEAAAAVDKTEADLKKSREDVAALEERLEGLQKLTGDDVWQKLDNSNLETVEEEIAALKARESKEKAALDEVKAQSEEWKANQVFGMGLLKATGSKLGLVENEYDEWGKTIAAQKGKLQSATEQVQLKMRRLAKRLGLGDDDKAIERLGEVLKYREEKKTAEAQLRVAKDNLKQATEANKQAKKGNETQKQIKEAQDKRKKAEDDLRKEEEKRKKVEEEWREKQKETHDEQLKYAREQLQGMKEGTDAYKQWAERVRQVEAALRMRGWQEAQTRTLAEQQAYVERMLGATKEGTLEWEKWRDEAKKLSNAAVSERLGEIEKEYKTTRNYAEVSTETAAQSIAADRRALKAKQRHLLSLLRTPDLDAKTQKEVNEKLVETRKELDGFAVTMRKGAIQAARDLQNARLPDMRAQNKQFTGNLKQVQKAYTQAVRRAAMHAAKGDSKALKRDIAIINRLSKRADAIAGYTGEAFEKTQKDLEGLSYIYNAYGRGKGNKKTLQQIAASSGDEKSPRSAKTKKNRPQKKENRAREVTQSRRKLSQKSKKNKSEEREEEKTPENALDTTELNSAVAEPLKSAASAAKSISAASKAMKEVFGKSAERLSQAMQGAASEMQSLKNAIDSKFSSVLSDINNLRAQINNIKNDISR